VGETQSRVLSSAERALTKWLLDVEFEGKEALVAQAREARVALAAPPPPWRSPYEFDVVRFEIAEHSPRFPRREHVPVGADSKAHGSCVQVMLFVDVGAQSLYSIRVKDVTADRTRWTAEFPSIDDFHAPYRNYVVEAWRI